MYVIGGTSVVSNAVVDQIKALAGGSGPLAGGINVIRLGGADRYATNALVVAQAAATGTVALTAGGTAASAVVIATGNGFADALAAGPIAANGFPLLLNTGSTLTSQVSNYLTTTGVKQAIIVGGTSAIPASVATALTGMGVTVLRLAGADRTTTAEAIANFEITKATGTTVGLGWSTTDGTVHVARGDDFADALAAGPVAGNGMQSILLATSPSVLGPGASDFLMTETADVYATINALGLTAAVNTSTLQAAAVASAG